MTNTENTTAEQTAGDNVVPLHPDLRQKVRSAMRREGLSLRQVAQELGTVHSTLSRWLDGEPVRTATELEAAALDWLRDHGRSRGLEPFVETYSAERILSGLAYAQAFGDLVAIYGGPGVGKTRSIQHYQSLYPNVWVVTLSPSCSGVVPALEEICDAVGLSDVSGGARRLARAIRSRVLGAEGLLILDEAQHLSQGAIEEIRSLHDWCRAESEEQAVGVALVGNETVYSRLTGPQRAAAFAQLYSRIGMRIYLARPTPGDVRALARQYQVTDKKCLALLERVADRPGALRGCVKALRLARRSSGGQIDLETLQTAVQSLGVEL